MPDHHLKPHTALGQAAAVTQTVHGVLIRENPNSALASLATRRGRAADVARMAQSVGLALPGPGQISQGTPWSALWIGPEQWLVEAPFASHEDIVSHLAPIFGDAASLTEQTDAWVRFDLQGQGLAAVFERLCALNLRAMADLGGARTVIEHIGVFVLKLAEDHITVLGPRSSAASLHHALITAAKSAL